MAKKDERFDVYIAKSGEFARPILTHLRSLVHEACPDVEETWKWSFPNFDYKGILCSMAAFKNHCTFGFWKASLMTDEHKLLERNGEAMGQLGRIESLADLPDDAVLITYIKEAVELNEKGVKLPPKVRTSERKALEIPESLIAALEGSTKASETFENFSYSHKKEYVEWITEAKTEETRNKRLGAAIEQMAEGKSKHWKYARK